MIIYRVREYSNIDGCIDQKDTLFYYRVDAEDFIKKLNKELSEELGVEYDNELDFMFEDNYRYIDTELAEVEVIE